MLSKRWSTHAINGLDLKICRAASISFAAKRPDPSSAIWDASILMNADSAVVLKRYSETLESSWIAFLTGAMAARSGTMSRDL
jgi:hypothetical protein